MMSELIMEVREDQEEFEADTEDISIVVSRLAFHAKTVRAVAVAALVFTATCDF